VKKLIHIFLLVSIVIVLQNCSNQHEKAEKFAQNGNYQAFYQTIEGNLKNNDKTAKNLLINYCFKAIQNGNLQEVGFYLQKEPQLVNMIDDEGNRAIDVVLFDENINILMLQLLLQYNPQLDYIVQYYDMTPLQVIVSGKYDNIEAIKLLLNHGADVNFVGHSNKSKNTPLILSYVVDKIEVFSTLLNNKAKIVLPSNNIYNTIASSYGLYLKNHGVDLHNFYNKSLSKLTRSQLHSDGYKTLHEKNMKYIELLQKVDTEQVKKSWGMAHLMKWYIKTKDYKALKILLKGRVCKKTLQEMKS
jgi:hypothetical protein